MSRCKAVMAWVAMVVGTLCVVACGARTPLDTSSAEPPGTPTTEPDPPEPLVMDCPSTPDDARLPTGYVGEQLVLDGNLFARGGVESWGWTVVAEKCDRILPHPRYGLENESEPVATFRPAHPGAYHLELMVTGSGGATDSCEFELPIMGRGLRVELCWDTSTQTDLDLYLHNPFDEAPWYAPESTGVSAGLDNATCNPANCPPELRLVGSRVSWGYENSPIEFCDPFSTEARFIEQGFCPNPRASTDNNQTLETGTAEVIQLDNPLDGQRFRVMVQNFDNGPAAPEVYLYCGAAEATVLGPDWPPRFQAPNAVPAENAFGVMWRAADIEVNVDEAGAVQGCQVDPLATDDGLNVTINDPSY